jgi:SAM-dependent methyltransferase
LERDHLEVNRANWDERVEIHAEYNEDFYDIDAFLAGASTLREIETGELGDVAGRSLIHLMCHFGLDTLSWARLGARVTGIDFSRKAVALATDLAERAGIEARFIECDVHDAPEEAGQRFDIVFASYGVLCWLPEMKRFMAAAARLLNPGGLFLLVDGHPFFDVFEHEDHLEVRYPYFHSAKPEVCDIDTSYVNKERKLTHSKAFEWTHDVADIVNAVLSNGLELLSFKEYPFTFYQRFPGMVRDREGRWILEGCSLPLLFSLKARKRS